MTRDEASKDLRRVSRVAFALERTFRLLQRLSPATHFSDPRTTEIYIGIWLSVGVALGVAWSATSNSHSTWLSSLTLIVCCLRVVDILQVAVNVALFDHLGNISSQPVNNVVRSLIFLISNYVELFGWFGLAYLPLTLEHVSGIGDRLYFSAVTQLTVGYGDITPIGAAKAISVLQAGLGWLLSLITIARFVAVLPNIRQIE